MIFVVSFGCDTSSSLTIMMALFRTIQSSVDTCDIPVSIPVSIPVTFLCHIIILLLLMLYGDTQLGYPGSGVLSTYYQCMVNDVTIIITLLLCTPTQATRNLLSSNVPTVSGAAVQG